MRPVRILPAGVAMPPNVDLLPGGPHGGSRDQYAKNHRGQSNDKQRRAYPAEPTPFEALDVLERYPLFPGDQGIGFDRGQPKIQGSAVPHPDPNEVVRRHPGTERLRSRDFDRAHRLAPRHENRHADDGGDSTSSLHRCPLPLHGSRRRRGTPELPPHHARRETTGISDIVRATRGGRPGHRLRRVASWHRRVVPVGLLRMTRPYDRGRGPSFARPGAVSGSG